MLRRYPDAIRTFVSILNFILRMRQYHTRSYQYDQVSRTFFLFLCQEVNHIVRSIKLLIVCMRCSRFAARCRRAEWTIISPVPSKSATVTSLPKCREGERQYYWATQILTFHAERKAFLLSKNSSYMHARSLFPQIRLPMMPRNFSKPASMTLQLNPPSGISPYS